MENLFTLDVVGNIENVSQLEFKGAIFQEDTNLKMTLVIDSPIVSKASQPPEGIKEGQMYVWLRRGWH